MDHGEGSNSNLTLSEIGSGALLPISRIRCIMDLILRQNEVCLRLEEEEAPETTLETE